MATMLAITRSSVKRLPQLSRNGLEVLEGEFWPISLSLANFQIAVLQELPSNFLCEITESATAQLKVKNRAKISEITISNIMCAARGSYA